MRKRLYRNRVVGRRGRGLLNIVVPAILAELSRKDSILRKGIVKLFASLKKQSLSYKKEENKKIDADYEILSEKDINT